MGPTAGTLDHSCPLGLCICMYHYKKPTLSHLDRALLTVIAHYLFRCRDLSPPNPHHPSMSMAITIIPFVALVRCNQCISTHPCFMMFAWDMSTASLAAADVQNFVPSEWVKATHWVPTRSWAKFVMFVGHRCRMHSQAEGWETGDVTLTRLIGPGLGRMLPWEPHP